MKLLYPFLGLAATATLLLSSCDTTRETVSSPASSGALPSESGVVDTVTSFRRDLNVGTSLYQVRTTGEGSMRLLTVRFQQGGREVASLRDTLDGEVQQAALIPASAANALPSLLVFVQSAGSGSYGQIYGYWPEGQTLRRVPALPELAGPASQGYQGHDTFRVLGQEVLRTFPIYAPADANCCPSGGQRTVHYTLPDRNQGFRQVRIEQQASNKS